MTKSLRLMKRFVIIPRIGFPKISGHLHHHHHHQIYKQTKKSIVSISISIINLSSQDEQKPKSRHATERRLRCSGAQVLTERRLRCKSTAAERKLFSF